MAVNGALLQGGEDLGPTHGLGRGAVGGVEVHEEVAAGDADVYKRQAAVGRRVGNARVVKHLLRILQTGLAEVHGVVVRQGDDCLLYTSRCV